jgi:hypothetical protein
LIVRRRSAAIGVAFWVGWFAGCWPADVDADAVFRAEVHELQPRTTLLGRAILAESTITRDTWGAEATWDIELTVPWEDYARRVSERLAMFHRKDAPPDRLQFTRSLPGDTDSLLIEALPDITLRLPDQPISPFSPPTCHAR